MKPRLDPKKTARVKAEIERCSKIASTRFGVDIDPTVIYDHPRGEQRQAGEAFYDSQKLYFNPWYLENEPDLLITRTVPHEFAHLVVRKLQEQEKLGWKIDVHGPHFRKVMTAFGVPRDQQTAKHEFDPLVLPMYQNHFLYKCTKCGHRHIVKEAQHERLTENPARYRCVKCASTLEQVKKDTE